MKRIHPFLGLCYGLDDKMDPDSKRLGESSTKGFIVKNSSKWGKQLKMAWLNMCKLAGGRNWRQWGSKLKNHKNQGFTGENTERLKDWDYRTRWNYLVLEWSLSWQVMSRLKSRLGLTVSPASPTLQHCRWTNKIQSITAYFHLTQEEWHSHWLV